MRTLTPAERHALRAKAHHLHPFVSIGQHGLTPAVLHEIDVNLRAHELIKVRVFGDDRTERERLFAQICVDVDAAPVQHLGKTLTLWRPAPEPEPVAAKGKAKPGAARSKTRPGAAKPKAKHAAATPKAKPASARPKAKTAAGKPGARPAAPGSKRRRRGPR